MASGKVLLLSAALLLSIALSQAAPAEPQQAIDQQDLEGSKTDLQESKGDLQPAASHWGGGYGYGHWGGYGYPGYYGYGYGWPGSYYGYGWPYGGYGHYGGYWW